jgi:hypothetical protein
MKVLSWQDFASTPDKLCPGKTNLNFYTNVICYKVVCALIMYNFFFGILFIWHDIKTPIS